MTGFRWALIGLAAFACTHAPAADRAAAASACYAIADPDMRALCRAKALREPAHCTAIQKPDMRAQCKAQVSQ